MIIISQQRILQFSKSMIEEEFVRREKLKALSDAGINPYPSQAERSATIGNVLDQFDDWAAVSQRVTIVGRIMTIRVHGGLIFAQLKDATGALQILLKQDLVTPAEFVLFRDRIDPADFIQAVGTLFTTQRGEKTLQVTSWKILTKALLPLPEKWHGLSDNELRYRKRYLDLIMNDEVKQRLVHRSKIISAVRACLDAKGFLEVETPTLQAVYGGGFARPFKTHHNALDTDFYLRISDEMYLKRLLVGGLEQVYEITKVFRNEGIDRDHNPEFTMFEAQIAYADYTYGMNLFEEIFEFAAHSVFGTMEIPHPQVVISLKRPWKRLRLVEAIQQTCELDVLRWNSLEQAKIELKIHLSGTQQAGLEPLQSVGEVMAFAFEELVEAQLIQPTIIYDYPAEVSPLAKKTSDPRFTERFEVFALGSEIGNNYSELNDPLDLEKRFMYEKKKHAAGFEEAQQTDVDYCVAIQHGMPPACGLGIGIDRMVMLLTGTKNIKEVILFPTLRPVREKEAI